MSQRLQLEKALTLGRNEQGQPVVTGLQVMGKQGGSIKGSASAAAVAHLHYEQLIQPPIGGDNSAAKKGQSSFVFGADGRVWEVGMKGGNSVQRRIGKDGTPGEWKPFGSERR